MAFDRLRSHGAYMVAVIDSLWMQGHGMPAAILAYVTIDAFAAADRRARSDPRKDFSSGEDFKKWAGEFLLPGSELESQAHVTPDELWASRCGLLHAYSPFARDTVTKGVARLSIWTGFEGYWPGESWTAEEGRAGSVKFIGPHQLADALKAAMPRFFEKIEKDKWRAALVQSRERELFVPWVPTSESVGHPTVEIATEE
jgi:hypothetical protein